MSSNDIAVSVRGLSKSYSIAHNVEKHSTLTETLLHRLRNPLERAERETFWALKDVSFDIKKGDVVGIIGRNGAGKSTLLKILSRITEPTTGQIDLYGRVGSLLEVGTGFHPELTGRENIYLNGAILGMKRSEITRQFDAIVDFSGTEKFLDTPVKRYSSGMYVRLAFAVAAHLNPEILIVDEVLAVGDSEFQKKCLGKMKDVAAGGRTVLFVSHIMESIAQLTHRCIMLHQGEVQFDGPTFHAVNNYIAAMGSQDECPGQYTASKTAIGNHVGWARLISSHENGVHRCGESLSIEFGIDIETPNDTLCFSFSIVNRRDQRVAHFWLLKSDVAYRTVSGIYILRCEIPKLRLYMGQYTLTTWLSEKRGNIMTENLTGICPFTITMVGVPREEYEWTDGECVYIEDCEWLPVRELTTRTA